MVSLPYPYALVVQRIGQQPSKLSMGVRFPPGANKKQQFISAVFYFPSIYLVLNFYDSTVHKQKTKLNKVTRGQDQ